MFWNLLFFVILLAIFTLSICLQIKHKKIFNKQPLSYYLTVIIPQSVFLSVIFILFTVSSNSSTAYLVAGILIYSIGFLVRLKTISDLKSNYNISKEKISDQIMTTGIYGYVRHPLYLGTLFIYFGFCLMLFSKIGVALYFIFLIPLFFIRIKEEEKEFSDNSKYQQYRKEVSCLIPFIF